ncbi:mucin-2 [Anopheles darlingi]|uniref:mucin-2 n=1 Tax=Anopheles darlingi TaxID=43151 RepID=UPI0021001618|nr:mucin-2 [Anopheles darlingi]
MRQKPQSNYVMSFRHIFIITALSCCIFVEAGERWSRQLTEFTGETAPGNDWIPLSRSNERQHAARVLNYFTAPTGPQQQPFLSSDNTAQAQQHHFTFLNHQFPQSNRFVLQQQPQLQELGDRQQFHLSGFNQATADPKGQAFFHQRAPAFVGQMIQHPPPPPPPPPSSPQGSSSNPFEQQFFSKDPLAETLHTEEEKTTVHVEQPFSYQHIRQQDDRQAPHQSVNVHTNSNTGGPISQEEVQLLYVPVETLFNQKSGTHPSSTSIESNRFNSLPQPVSPSLINEFYTAGTTTTPGPNSVRTVSPQSLRSSPYTVATTQSSQTLQPSSSTTKPKPNQPPLALFLFNDGGHGKLSTNEVLGGLKNINEIAVLDAVSKNSPKVFIGPSGLTPPKSYSRFDLPYLSSVDQSTNRANRKIDEHPFFVAPLSYNTPSGYTKIALPSPHVGSIIVRQSISSNSLEQETQYTRPTSQSNVQYYTPSTFNFPDTVTKQPTRQVYDADLYTTPTRKTSPSQAQFNSFSQNQNISPTLASRNSPVDEEYFNLAKTKKPTVTPPTQKSNYPLRPYATGSTRQFDFKPMPDHKIPSFYDASSNSPTTTPITTTSTFTTTTENPSTNPHTQFDVERLRTHFREENFRSRRPHQQQTSTERYDQTAINVDSVKETDFVHKFKLVDSVRPTHTKSVVDNGYLDFFQSPTRSSQKEEGIKTIATTILPGRAQEGQAIRNNYYTAAAAIGEEQVSARQKYVSTYFSPELSTTAGTAPPTTATTTLTTQDAFFREFEQKSKFYEREPKYEMPHRYETETFSESHRYSADTTKPIESTTPSVEPMIDTTADQQQYSIPSELPPISANLPGLVNALMDDPWAVQPKDSRTKSPEVAISPVGANRASNFRKQLHRTTAQPSSQDFYDSEPLTTTTKRPLQRSRRPHPSRTTTATPEYTGAQTSSSRPPISRSRSRYVPNNDERPVAVRSRGRSRLNTPREPSKQEENLDYQRDVLKQNYPVIRPQSSNGLDIATTAAPTTTAPTTLSYKETNEAELADRFISTTLTNEVPLGNEPVTRKYSIQLSQPYESEVMLTTGQPLQTTVFFSQTDEHLGDEVVRSHDVIPSDRNIETHSHSVIPLRSKQPTSSTEATVRQSLDQSVTEIENKITETTDLPRNENMELQKIETTTRSGRRPSLISRQRQNVQSTRTTTERPTTVHTTTAEIPRAAERRPAFVRRPSRLYATTTVPPTTTLTTPTELYNEQSTQGSYSLRTKNRQDILRGRTRRPTTSTAEFPVAATTASPDLTTRGFGRGGNQRRVTSSVRTRQEPNVAPTTQQTPSSNGPRFRIRERTRFTLQPQESQWSARLNQNSFQPILKSEARNIDSKDENTFQDPETEIVTAAQDSDVYLVNVSSKYKQKDSEEAEFSEDSTEKRVSSFADLLNDVMKDFIQDNNDKETFLPKGQALLAKSNHRELGEEPRRPSNNRNNFLRKRKQPKVIDSFETAESQHINHAAQVLNSPAYIKDSLKNIDLVGLTAKNDNLLYGNQKTNAHPEDEENTAHEETTANSMKDRSEEVMEVDYKSNASLADSVNFTTALPTEELSTMINVDQTTTSLSILQDSAIAEAVTTIPTSNKDTNIQLDNVSQQGSGIFDDVKKKISDLYEMADNDSDTEEEIDGVQIGTVVQGAEVAEDMYIETTDETLLQEVKDTDDGDINDAEPDMASSETQFESVVSDLVPAETPKVDPMGSLVIPTSISSGITHDTEICYRGRCIKTDKKDKTG